nr:nucleoside-diphosphate-sugar epimerase [Pseudomonadota bacterium]
SVSILEVAEQLARVLGKSHLEAQISGDYRVGDIRHCFADIGQARVLLGYAPQVSLEAGLAELAAWMEGRSARDRVEEAGAELARRGLRL